MANSFLGRTDFNVGQDVSITLRSSNGDSYAAEQLGHLTEADAELEDNEVELKPISGGGRHIHMHLPAGVSGKFVFARMNGTLDKMLIQNSNRWYDEGLNIRWDIQVQIRNRDASIDTYMFKNCQISKGKLIGARADKELDQGFNFKGSYVQAT